jgi:anti-sigma factor RsiW
LRCGHASRVLTAVVDGSDSLPPRVASHLETCLRCQVDVVRYRRIARTMRQLGGQLNQPAPGLVLEILARVEAAEAASERSSRHRRTAYLAAATAATAAGAAGALVIATRSRRGRLGLAG